VERENVFAFTEKPRCRHLGDDKYEITFAVKGYCDVTVGLLDEKGAVVRHLGSGVLGPNAPAPFQKNSLSQKIYWDGKDDLERYPREPGKLTVQVRLGLKPTFERLLGWETNNLIGTYRGLAADAAGVCVISGESPQVRRYDRDGNYVKTIFPPAADVPLDKLKGLEKLEYEPNRWALHAHIGHGPSPGGIPSHPPFSSTISGHGVYFPAGAVQPQDLFISKGMLVWSSSGTTEQVVLYRMDATDGSSDEQHYFWRRLSRVVGKGKYAAEAYYSAGEFANAPVSLAASPDGKWIYISRLFGTGVGGGGDKHAVYRLDANTRENLGGKPWVGQDNKPGSDNQSFNLPMGVACDAEGRVYVCDNRNNRVQVFDADGRWLKTVQFDFPEVIRINPKTGAIYLVHVGREGGRSRLFLSKLNGFADPSVAAKYEIRENPQGRTLLEVDVSSSPPRIWLTRSAKHLVILEDQGTRFQLIRDFAKDAEAADFPQHDALVPGPWSSLIACDPMREKVYVGNKYVFDLKSGRHEGAVSLPHQAGDLAFDKKGYMHIHFDPGFYVPGVARVDPDQNVAQARGGSTFKEVPYDYGIEKEGRWGVTWKGILPVKDQPVAKWQQDGLAVNMRGDVAEVCHIAYIPKMEDAARPVFSNMKTGTTNSHSYADFIRNIAELEKRGEQQYFIKRKPGRRLNGCTVWVFDQYGELFRENIVPGAPLINGVGLDEDNAVYFTFASTKMVGGRAFLSGRGKIIGSEDPSFQPFTGTLMKASAAGAEIVSRQAPIQMDKWPERPNDAAGCGWGWNSTKDNDWTAGKNGDWVEGAEWLYAGASPIVPLSCICPASRLYTDWYKRTFVPEAYRHSIGVVDTAGNLIMHIGRYGNADSGRGADSPVKIGGDEIALAHVMTLSATERHLCLTDFANERIIVLKLDYHAEEKTPVSMK
jgi:hypothetical protein